MHPDVSSASLYEFKLRILFSRYTNANWTKSEICVSIAISQMKHAFKFYDRLNVVYEACCVVSFTVGKLAH